MRLIICSLAVVIVACSITAQSIDEKYAKRNPELYEQYHEARDLLNSWQGQRRKLRTARVALLQILEEDPEFAPTYIEYARYMLMSGYISGNNVSEGSLESAESAILKSIEIEPEYADAFVLLGHLYTLQESYEDAETALHEAERIGTDSPWLHLNWADLHKEREQFHQAIRRYQSIVDAGTDNRKAMSAALHGVTTMHARMGDYDEAAESYKLELEYTPDSAWTWGNYAGFLLFWYGDVDSAIEAATKALDLMDYGMARSTLGCAFFTKWAQLKDNPATQVEAEKYFEKALEVYPYPDEVISRTIRYDKTRPTGQALMRWQQATNQDSG